MKHWITVVAVSAACQVVSAMPVINVGSHQLQPGSPNQAVDIYVSGGDSVAALNIFVQVGNGTDGLAAPTIESVNIIGTGMVFGANNTGQAIGDDYPHEMSVSTTTLFGTVAAEGKLATLYIDTTGYSSGTWSLILSSYTAQNGSEFDKPTSDFAGIPIQITDGSITVAVPEPTSIAAIALGAMGLLRRTRRLV